MIALSAVQFLPSSEAAKSSERAAYNRPRTIYEVAKTLADPQAKGAVSQSATGIFGEPEVGLHHSRLYNFSISPWRLVEFIWPNIGGRMYPTNRRWMSQVTAEGLIWTPSLYLGLLPLLLAVGQFSLRSSCHKTRWLSWVALSFVLGSLGYYGLGWFLREFYSTVLRGDSSRLGIGQPVGGLYWLMVTLLPTYVNFRYPAKLLVVAVAAICVLGALGWDQVLAQPARRQRLGLWLRVIGGASFVLLALVWLFRQKAAEHTWLPDLTHGPFDFAGSLRDVLGSLLHTAILAYGFAWLLGKVLPQKDLVERDLELSENASHNRWIWGVVGLVALDLVVANAWLIPLAETKTWREPSPLASVIYRQEIDRPANLSQGGVPRVYRGNLSGWHANRFRSTTSAKRMQEATRWEHETLFPKFGLLDDLSAVFSYGSIKPIDFESFFYVADQHGPPQTDPTEREHITTFPHPHALRLIGTEHAITPAYYQLQMGDQKPFGERQVLPSDQPFGPADCQLWKLSKPMPRTWVVSRVVLLPKLPLPTSFAAMDQRTLQVLFPLKGAGEQRYARNFSREAVVESDAAESLQELITEPAKTASGESSATATSEIVRYAPNCVVLKANLEQAGLVVLSDAYDAGWVARVFSSQGIATEPTQQAFSQAKSLPIWRTNRILRGMHLPAGQHWVELRYEPRSYYYGARLSLLSWSLIAVLAVWQFWFRRNHKQPVTK